MAVRKLVFGVVLAVMPHTGINAAEQGLRTLDFYTDETDKDVEMPGANCEFLIDDDKAFSALRVGKVKIRVSAAGRNDHSASLILDCAGELIVYTLRYNPRKKYGVTTQQRSRGRRSDAYAGSTLFTQKAGELSSSFELGDYSEPLLQISARETMVRSRNVRLRTDSVDSAHQGADWRLNYGFSRALSPLDDRLSYRLGVGLYGLSLAHSRSILLDSKTEDRFTWAHIPHPVKVSLAYGRKSDGSEVKFADRFSSGRLGLLSATALVRIFQEKDAAQKISEGVLARLEQRASEVLYSPVNSNTIECKRIQHCFLTNWTIRQPIEFKNGAFLAEYSPVPHSAGSYLTASFSGVHEFNFGIKHFFKQKSFASRWRFVRSEEQDSGTSEASNLHLEADVGNYLYYVDQSASFMRKTPLTTSLGVRFNGDKIQTGLRLTKESSKKPLIGALFDLRYFFDKNIRSVSVRLVKAKVRVRVLSNAGDKPVLGARVILSRDNVLIESVDTSEDGEAVLTEARCCGDFQIKVSFNGFVSEASIFVSETMLEPSVTVFLEDHRKVYIDYFLKKNGSKIERLNLPNFYPEVSEAVVAFKGAAYEGNLAFVPISSFAEFELNESLLPFRYRVVSIEGANFDTKKPEDHRVRVILEDKE